MINIQISGNGNVITQYITIENATPKQIENEPKKEKKKIDWKKLKYFFYRLMLWMGQLFILFIAVNST